MKVFCLRELKIGTDIFEERKSSCGGRAGNPLLLLSLGGNLGGHARVVIVLKHYQLVQVMVYSDLLQGAFFMLELAP